MSLITNCTVPESQLHSTDLSESYHGTSAKFSLASQLQGIDIASTAAAGPWKSSTLERKKPPTKSNSTQDRTNDAVYAATTSVVKAIMALSHGVERAVAREYLDLVRNVGVELRTLLSSVDVLAAIFPATAIK